MPATPEGIRSSALLYFGLAAACVASCFAAYGALQRLPLRAHYTCLALRTAAAAAADSAPSSRHRSGGEGGADQGEVLSSGDSETAALAATLRGRGAPRSDDPLCDAEQRCDPKHHLDGIERSRGAGPLGGGSGGGGGGGGHEVDFRSLGRLLRLVWREATTVFVVYVVTLAM